jgi:hypothetical protein|tara:strand:+ start:311 stop:775 length:465 start_codon:yes stop_codon:yes gene_type:complete
MASRSIYSDTKIRVRASNLSPRQRYTIELKNITTGESKIFKQNSIGTSLHKVIPFKSGGVVQTIIKDKSGRVVKKNSTVGTAEIDCCIAKLVHDAITCSCKCHKCVEDLKRAETIYLLLQSAKHEAHVLGNVEMAAAKVLKAKELCTEVCACGC